MALTWISAMSENIIIIFIKYLIYSKSTFWDGLDGSDDDGNTLEKTIAEVGVSVG